jgi:hypothetical protein
MVVCLLQECQDAYQPAFEYEAGYRFIVADLSRTPK